MRAIDADKMKADLLTVDPQFETMIDWCISVLDAQPTIEPERKRGHKVVKSNGMMGYWVCDQCEKPVCPTDNYCARCGAYLREDTNERFNKQTGGD